jgi:Raf kinase inhibitor-like YbhB/YbcL family protein
MPERTVSFALLVDDPDIPAEITKERGITVFDHWVVINIPADVREIREGETAGVVGTNSAGTQTYRGPCPPKEYLPTKHRYFFRLYALDSELALNSEATKKDVLEATEGHVLASTELMGVYEKM